ncbi:hypothetical protein [Gloeothece citriformis]|nr:hypothetical protein [Gloeothece citriformis]
MAVALCMAIFAFVIPTVHQFVENLFIYDLGNNELNEPLEALIILVSYWFTIPIYNIFYEELIK